MRLFLSLFLLFTMLSGVAISVVQQIKDATVCEFKESKSDDENKDANEKESKTETEKDLFAYKTPPPVHMESWAVAFTNSKIHTHDEDLESSLYTFLPYNPPEL